MNTAPPRRLVNLDALKKKLAESLPLSRVAEELCDIDLVRAGGQWKASCPLHGEDTPSFYVNDAKGLWHCFGCKRGGDAIDLVEQLHHLGFVDTLTLMAEHAGVDLDSYTRPPTDDERKQDELRAWCERWLAGLTPHRGRVDVATAQAFGTVVPMAMQPHPYFVERDYLLRGEVLFPYRLPNGALVGWKVRHPDGKQFGMPLEFPLTAPTLFGIQVARPHLEGELVVVEGEWDTEALHEHGVHNVVGMGGSAFSDEQMAFVKSLKVRSVLFWFDGDEGGRTGARNVAERFWQETGIRVRVLAGPAGGDPEDLVRSVGPEMVRSYLAGAPDALEWLLRQEFERAPRQTMGQKLDFVRWLQAEYGQKLNGLQEAVVLREVAGWLGVPEADVFDLVQADKTLLQAVDSEKAVLGKALRDSNYFLATRKRIVADDFFVLKHQRLWHVLTDLLMEGLDFDLATVKRRAANQGVDAEYTEQLATTGDLNIGWHEDQVVDYAMRRGAQQDADRFRELIADLNVPATQLIGTLTHTVTTRALGRGSGALRPIQEQVDEAVDTLHERMANPDSIVGVSLGEQFPRLTRVIQGFQTRRFAIVAATSGVGKSTVTLDWATQMAVVQAIPTDFVSLEMDPTEILFKQASHLTGIDYQKVQGGRLDPAEAQRVERAMMLVRKSPLRIYAPDGITGSEFVLYCREAVMERRTEFFVLDYAQMVGPDPHQVKLSRYEMLGQLGYTIKQKVCRSLDVGVIACAQLNRASKSKDRPTKEDMGDSYDLVRGADVIVILHSEDDDSDMYDLWVDKNRQGSANILIPVRFDGDAQTFYEAMASHIPTYRVV